MDDILETLFALVGGVSLFCGVGVLMADVLRSLKTPVERIIGPHESARFPRVISRRSRIRVPAFHSLLKH